MAEYWKSAVTNYWCEICRTFVRDTVASRTLHENGPKHKDLLERKLKAGRIEKERKQREEQAAKSAMEKIDQLAMRQYQRDQAGMMRTAGKGASQGGKPRGARGAAELEADLQVKKAAELAYRQGQSANATTNSSSSEATKVTDWAYDAESGYYFSLETGSYYDGHTKMYYFNGEWTKTAPRRTDAAKFERFFETAADDVAEGRAAGPVAPGTQRQQTTLGAGVASKAAAPGRQASASHPAHPNAAPSGSPAPAALSVVVKPIKKVAERSNQSLGGYQMPLYGGKVGGARQIGRVVGEAAAGSSSKAGKAAPSGLHGSSGAIQKKRRPKGAASRARAPDPEEEKALRAREAAKRRVEQRTMAGFGFS